MPYIAWIKLYIISIPIMTRTRIFTQVIFILFILGFSACKKQEQCPPTGSITLTSSNTVYVGSAINLKANTSIGYTYKYTGPNGFEKVFGHTNYSGDVMILNATPAMGGIYTLEEYSDEGCVVSRGSVDVPVLAVPNAPCSPTNNTSTSNVIGAGDFTFNYVSFTGSANMYIVSGSEVLGGGAAFMRFAFMGSDMPKDGIYKTDPTYFSTAEGRVGLFVQNGPYDFGAAPFQDVYVKRVNGKLQITFCQLSFSNPIGSTPIKVSCRITQP